MGGGDVYRVPKGYVGGWFVVCGLKLVCCARELSCENSKVCLLCSRLQGCTGELKAFGKLEGCLGDMGLCRRLEIPVLLGRLKG